MLALWLWATVDGVGSARQLDRLCRDHLVYRWLCGGVSMNYHSLSNFPGRPYGGSGTASGAGRRVDGSGWFGVGRHVGAGWLAGARGCRGEFVPPAAAAW